MESKLFLFEKLKNFSDKQFIIHRIAETKENIYNYSQIIKESQDLLKVLKKIKVGKTRISIQCPHSPELCVILLSILNAECSFCPISQDVSEDEVIDTIKKYASIVLISLNCLSNKIPAELVCKHFTLNSEIYIYKFKSREVQLHNECYSIQTSGSTGIAKIVRVPYSCIAPNIDGLSEIFEVTSNDLIFMSSPITFDPFVVEYFLALRNGAALLITDPAVRFTASRLSEVLQPKSQRGATILQMTPSLFRLFNLSAIQEELLSHQTSIRILVLGGERFPSIEEISQWTAENHCQTRIFNIYGITEVSCWSTFYELKRPLVETRIPIGLPIDKETQIRLVDDMNQTLHEGFGNIQIGSATRKCIIDNDETDVSSSDVVFRSSGDIGSISNGKIFYEGRKTETIKRYGNRVHMGKIDRIILAADGVVNACCIFNEENMKLIFFILKKERKPEKEILRELGAGLEKFEQPDDVQFVDSFPITSHGKISKRKLLLDYENLALKTPPINMFERFIENVLGLDLGYSSQSVRSNKKQRKLSLDLSFLDAGGTSFQALTLSTQIQEALQRSEPELLLMMLNGVTTISTILEYISNISTYPAFPPSTASDNSSNNTKEMLKVKWQYDTGKCVDATPRCYGNVVCVGSHSHQLITLDSKSGREVSKCILPDRIECQVSFIDDRRLLVGCYDGNSYCIDYTRGAVEWQYNCEGIIKAKPLINGELAVIGNYSSNGNLVCLQLKEKSALWKMQIGSNAIFASPIQIDAHSLLVCTLSGETVRVSFSKGNIEWKAKFEGPIFSTPAILDGDKVLVAEVIGIVHCLDVSLGTELWNFRTDGNIFSSIKVHYTSDEKYILFGNHDHNVYCLKSSQSNHHPPSVNWKSALNSAIFSTPAILISSTNVPAVLSFSTKGGVYILDLLTGLKLFTINMGNEIFSSPCIDDNRIYIGCRDNNLVCLELCTKEETSK